MRPFRRDPCAVCGRFLIEHHGKPSEARCAFHQDWKRPDVPPPAPPPMTDGRGREVPLRGYGKDHCVMRHKPNDQVGDPKPGLCLSCDFKATPEPKISVQFRPVQVGPCTRCGITLEHDQDPGTVLCVHCYAFHNPIAKVKMEPPPTVEWRPAGNVPYACGLMAYTVLAMAAGFAAGLAFRGGV